MIRVVAKYHDWFLFMSNSRCPACGDRTISLFSRIKAGTFRPVKCGKCGAKLVPTGFTNAVFAVLETVVLTVAAVTALFLFSWWAMLSFLLLYVFLELVRGLLTQLKEKE